jgi:spermidine synthase
MAQHTTSQKAFLIMTIIMVGMCSIVYELLISTTASYFMGDSVRQFSLIIGIYMASMGIGAWISRFIDSDLMYRFIFVEVILGCVGALSVPLCYLYFAYADYEGFNFFVFLIIFIIGMLTGLEIPILTRLLEKSESLKNNISNILAFDYLGALVATILFPFFLVPFVGLYKSSLIFGLINIAIGLITFLMFKDEIQHRGKRNTIMLTIGLVSILVIGYGLYTSAVMISKWNDKIFKYNVTYQEESPYQSIVLTNSPEEFRLYLNGAIQFSSRDEYRYHEALVHVPCNQVPAVNKVLMLGGGEGLAAREVLKYEEVQELTIVDIDPSITQLSQTHPQILALNMGALEDPRVKVVNEDAFTYLMKDSSTYDVIICDLPDPTSETLARLYSNVSFKMMLARLNQNGALVSQATSPDLTSNAFWCIEKTMQDAGFRYTFPYHASIPSFGTWGFIMAKQSQYLKTDFRDEIELKYMENDMLQHLMYFPKDKRNPSILPNRLDQPILMDYYIDHWRSLQGKER